MQSSYELPTLEAEELRYMLLQLMELQNITVNSLLENTGVDASILSDPHYRLTFSQEIALYSRVADLNKNPYLGIDVGKKLGLAHYGILGFAMATSATIGHAIDTLIEFGYFINLSGNLFKQYQPQQNTLSLVLASTPMDITTQALEAETTFTSLLTLFNDISGKNITFQRVDFTHHRAAKNLQIYIDLFGGEVFFSQEKNCITLPISVLTEKLAHGDHTHNKIIRDLCRNEMTSWMAESDFPNATKQFIKNNADGFTSIETTAAYFNLSVRSFRRRLNDTNTSFRAISNEIKHEAACRYLTTTRLSIETIARLLGYSEASSFRIAFKKWAGVSPAEFGKNKIF